MLPYPTWTQPHIRLHMNVLVQVRCVCVCVILLPLGDVFWYKHQRFGLHGDQSLVLMSQIIIFDVLVKVRGKM